MLTGFFCDGPVTDYTSARRADTKRYAAFFHGMQVAAWVGADHNIIQALSDAGIPNYPTEDDAVRGFMHLVRHREVVEELSQVPPAMPDTFVPDARTARKIVTAAIADGRKAAAGIDQYLHWH